MKRKTLVSAAALLALLAAAGYGLYWLGTQRGMAAAPAAGAGTAAAVEGSAPGAAQGEDATRRHLASGLKAGDVDPVSGRRILYYHDPMVPGHRFDKPARSPFMDMMLVPVYAGASADAGQVSVSPRMQQTLGVRTAVATQGLLAPELAVVGSIAFNERQQAVVQARAAGYVERLRVAATLDRVRPGQVLAELFVPDWVAAQEEFLGVRRLQGAGIAPLVEGAKSRMRLAGMSEAQIRAIEASGRANPRTLVVAPTGGLVTEVGVREGMTVAVGSTLFRISDDATVWAHAEVPESQVALVRPGVGVRARTPAVPGVVFEGRIQALLPAVEVATRTLKARAELRNPQGRLVPGMFVTMQFTNLRAERGVLIPTEAVIHTGRRTVVILAEQGGGFRAIDVQTGTESGGQTEIRSGLQAGQRVVVSSQFLIDSEASLKGVETRLNQAAPAAVAAASAPAAAAPRHQGEARVTAVAPDTLTLLHGPIPSIRWGTMTMDFKAPAPPAGLPPGLRPGDRVSFEFYIDRDDLPQLTRVTPVPGGSK